MNFCLLKERKWLITEAEDDSFKFIMTCSPDKYDLPLTFAVFPNFAVSYEHFRI